MRTLSRDTMVAHLDLIEFEGDTLACGTWLKLAPKEERPRLMAVLTRVAARYRRQLATPALLVRIRTAIREEIDAMPEGEA